MEKKKVRKRRRRREVALNAYLVQRSMWERLRIVLRGAVPLGGAVPVHKSRNEG